MSRNDSTVTAFWCGGGDEQVMRWDSPPSEVQRPTPEPESGEVTGDRGPFPVGCVLGGKYRIDRMLGAGTMASVFAATHVRNANRVAVKILHPAFENNLDVRARFLREGYAANSVRRAGTVRALDDDTTEDGATFMVMELLEGETLESLSERRGRRLPPSEVAGLMGQLLDILVAAHERGIVHRDIKPENLFVQSDGRLRILDFGVARVLEGSVTETRAGSVIGTLPYMAPEQILGKSREVEARSDVWSVGATAFTLVSGRFVHEAETPEEMMVFAGSRQARSLASVSPDVPDAFIQVVDRALRFEKSERWPDARSMQAAFASAAASPERLEENAPSNGGEPPPSPRTSLSEFGRSAAGEPPSCGAWCCGDRARHGECGRDGGGLLARRGERAGAGRHGDARGRSPPRAGRRRRPERGLGLA